MVSINKSFLYGICFASVTWAISLYLFWQLNNTTNVLQRPTDYPSYENYALKNVSDEKGEHKIHNFKDETREEKKAFKQYVNRLQSQNNLQPVYHNPGKDTYEKDLIEIGMVKTMADKRIKDDGYKLYAFNVLISNNLSYYRSIPDTRNKLCRSILYPSKLPSASIIICFYNEHNHTLLRTVHSIINRTQPEYLTEIILIDDYSDIPDLHEDIGKYIHNFNAVVKLYKTERREGLIRARMFGARKATGQVIVFLDSHIEVNKDWLRPLLGRIKENRTNIAIPIIDIINADTFTYTASPLVRGGFNWGLHFKWENLPTGTLSKDEDFIKPIKSPTMAGGLFAIDRKYFMEMGEYDAGMNVWGGENLEISFRIWMCGGKLDLIPCSRVGHIFRQRRPYGAPDGQDTMLYNSLRVANVWMDDYQKYFIKQRKPPSNYDYGDVSSRLQLRKRLKCHDFDWYLKTIYPELILPTDDNEKLKKKWAALEQSKFQPWHSRKRNYVDHFQIRLWNSSLCIQSSKDVKSKGSTLVLKSCMRSKQQLWFETDKSELVLAQLLCLQADNPNAILYKCHESGGDQEWKHKGESKTPLYNLAAGTCLGVEHKDAGAILVMKLCGDAKFAAWDLVKQ